jgi:hypothetical protein
MRRNISETGEMVSITLFDPHCFIIRALIIWKEQNVMFMPELAFRGAYGIMGEACGELVIL